jgi:cytochrome b561
MDTIPAPEGPVVTLRTYEIPVHEAEEFERNWTVSIEMMRQQPGFLSATLHKPVEHEGSHAKYVNYAVWESASAFAAAWHGMSAFATILAPPEFKEAVSRARESGARDLFFAVSAMDSTVTEKSPADRSRTPVADSAQRDIRKYQSTKERYGPVAIALHWISVILILLAVPLGFAVQNVGDDMRLPIFLTHAVIGVTVGVLTLIRLAWWTLADRMPGPLPGQSKATHFIARATHGFFYFALLFLAVGGIMISISKVLGPTLAVTHPEILPYLQFPVPAHNFIARLFIALLVLHVIAALYHHWIKRDGVLTRMSPPQTLAT